MVRTTKWISKAIVVGVLLFSGVVQAQTPSKMQQVHELIPLLKDIPGISKLPVRNVQKHGGVYTSADVTLHGHKTTIVGFKENGIQMGAVVPSNFKLTDVLPIPSGTPFEGVRFPHVAVIYLPAGHNKQILTVSKLPNPVRTALPGQTSVTLNAGLNLLGKADFSSSRTVKQVLQAVGVPNFSLPFNGTFSTDLFKADLKQADQLLDNLHLNMALPQLRIHGMPSSVSVKKGAQFSIVAKKLKNMPHRKYFAGVNGDLTAKIGAKTIDFDFYILAQKPGSSSNVITLKGDTGKKKTTLKVGDFTLESLNLVAVKQKHKQTWDVSVDATSELRNREIKVSASVPAHGSPKITITSQMTLAELTSLNVPGLTDVKLNEIKVEKDSVQGSANIRNMKVDIATFKKNGHTYIAVATPKSIRISNLIPQVGKTPLDDVSFDNMAYVWAPTGGALKNLQVSELPKNIQDAVTWKGDSLDVQTGLNVIGQLGIEKNGGLGKMLTAVGAYKSSLPLQGVLSPSVFKTKGGATQIKNDILDTLDLNIPLKVSDLHLPKAVNIQTANIEIKGVKDQGRRVLDVDVAGALDFTHGSSKVGFDFDVNVVKHNGQDKVQIKAKEAQGAKLKVSMIETFEFSNMDFSMNNIYGTWAVYIGGDAKIKNTPISLILTHVPGQADKIDIHPKGLTIAKLVGAQGLPGIDDVDLTAIEIYGAHDGVPARFLVKADVKGHPASIQIQKAPSRGHLVAVHLDDLSLASLVPGGHGSKSPLNRVTFDNMVALYNPGAKTSLNASGLKGDGLAWVQASHKNPELKQGLNIFGHIDAQTSGELKSMLSQIGVKDLKLPLRGAINPKTFSKNVASVKSVVLDSLDVNVPLNFNLPGISKAVNIQKANIEITGKDAQGKPALNVDVAGVLDFTHGSSKVDFDFDVNVVKHNGQDKVQIKAKEAQGAKLKVSMIETFEFSNMDFSMNNIYGTWAVYIGGDAKIGTTPISLILTHVPGQADKIDVHPKGLTIAKLIGAQGLPGIDDVDLTAIEIYGAHGGVPARFLVKADVKGHPASIQIQKAPSRGHFIAVDLGDLNLGNLIPGAKSTLLKDVEFSNMVMVHSPTGASSVQLKSSGIGGDAQYWIEQSNKNPVIKSGMNVFGHMDVKPSGALGRLLKDVGVREVKLPLNGKFSPQALSKNANTQAIKQAILKNLDIKIDLPKLAIPGTEKYLTLTNDRLEVSGKKGLLVKVKADADVRIKSDTLAFTVEVDYDKSSGAQATDLEVKGQTDRPWNKPFGISFLDLKGLGLDINKKKNQQGTREYDLDITAKAQIGRHTNLDVAINIQETNGKLTGAYFELDGPISLADIPEVNKVPHADKFALDTLIISEHGIEADTTFKGHKTDFYAFKGSGWNVAITQTDFNLGELVPTPGDLLKEIKLPFAAVMLSESGLNKSFKHLSKVGQDALKDVFSKKEQINIKEGLAIVAGFHPDNAGSFGKHLKKIGVHDKLAIMGEVSGIFDSTQMASLTLKGVLASASPSLPSFLSFVKSEQLDFYISASETELDLGLDVDITTKIKGDTLQFDTTVAVQDVDGEELGINITGSMKGTWHKPFDIPGFSISNPTITATIGDDGLKLGYAGTTDIAGDTLTIGSDIQFSEALIPDAGAFTVGIKTVDIFFVQDVALHMIGDHFKLGIPHGLFPKFTNATVTFVSPGAEAKVLGFTQQGLHVSGNLDWLGDKDAGTFKLTLNPTSGIDASGAIADRTIGPLELKDNNFTIDIDPLDFQNSKFIPTINLTSNIEIKYLDLHEDFAIALNKNGMSFKAHVDATEDFSFDTTLLLSGIDLSATHPGFKDADFSMEGDIKMDIGEFIGKPMTAAVNKVFNELNKGFHKAEAALTKAQDRVNHLTKRINAEREKIRKKRQAAEKKVENAEARVEKLRSDIRGAWHSYHHCSGLFKWFCKLGDLIEIAGLKLALETAEGALKFAATLIDHFPIDLDPEVGILLASRDVADGLLKAAKYGIKGLDVFNRIQKAIDNTIAKGVEDSININKVSFEVNLKEMIASGNPAIVSLDVDIFGGHIKQTLPLYINPKDIDQNVEKMAVVGMHGLWHLLEHEMNKISAIIPEALKHKLRNHVAAHANADAKKINAELVTYKKSEGLSDAELAAFKKVLNQKIDVSNDVYMKEDHIVSVLLRNRIDNRTTKTFAGELIEVGHTGLCLDNVKGDVRQDKCADGSATRWSTVTLSPKDTHTYVNIIDAKSKECIAPVGTWKETTKTYSDDKFGNKASFTFKTDVFTGDGELTVRKCGTSGEFAWKVLDHGTNWMLMANQATAQCLHFTASSSIPGQAKAEWKPCVGSANQVYRIMDSATPKYYADNISIRNDQLGLCLGEASKDKTVSFVDCSKAAFYDYIVDVRGFAKFINTRTGNCLQPDGYKIGAQMIEVPCTQLDYQWWDVSPQPGGIIIKNAQTKLCTNPPSKWEEAPPTQIDCASRKNAVFAPVRGKYRFSGTTWIFQVSGQPLPPAKDLYWTGKGGHNLCAFEFQGSLVPGLVVSHEGKWVCGTAFSDSVTPEAFSTGKFRLMTWDPAAVLHWYPNTGKKLSKLNIPTGGFGGGSATSIYSGSAANIYTCRTSVSSVGWTADGKTCHIFNFATAKPLVPATTFEILSRVDYAFYQLQGSASETIEQPTNVPEIPIAPPMKTAPAWIAGLDHAPYAWDTTTKSWRKQKGCIKRISVDSTGVPVAIQCDDYAVRWNGTDWVGMGGFKGLDIGSAKSTWAVGIDKKPYVWNGTTWVAGAGCFKRIDVAYGYRPVAVKCDGSVQYFAKTNKWVHLGFGNVGGAAGDVAAGGDRGAGWPMWALSGTQIPYQYVDNEWVAHSNYCWNSVDADAYSNPWGIGCDNTIQRMVNSRWVSMSGKALDIGVVP